MKHNTRNPWLSVAVGMSLVVVAACGDPEEEEAGGATVGPECTSYYGPEGCCLQAAGDVQQAKDACAQAGQAIEDSLLQGANPASTEAACKQLTDTAKSTGTCQDPVSCEVVCDNVASCGGDRSGCLQQCPTLSTSCKNCIAESSCEDQEFPETLCYAECE